MARPRRRLLAPDRELASIRIESFPYGRGGNRNRSKNKNKNMQALANVLATLVICAGLFGELVAGAVACARGDLGEPRDGFWTGILGIAGVLWVTGRVAGAGAVEQGR